MNLTCKAIAFPRPSVRWSVNGTVRAGEAAGSATGSALRQGLLVASGAESVAARQAHEYVENQHIASNLTVRVNHDLLRAGAMCRVSNALGAIEQHIQLLGECRALPAAAGARRSGGAPGPGAACCAVRCRRRGAELSLSLHSCPTSGVRQERSVWHRAGCAPARLLALGLRLPLRSLPSHQGNCGSVSACLCSSLKAACLSAARSPARAAPRSPAPLAGKPGDGWRDVSQEVL